MSDREKYERLQSLVIRECIDARKRAREALKAGNSDEWVRFSEVYGVLADIIREANDFDFMDKWIKAGKQAGE